MSKVGLIIKREYFSRVKKRSFILMTILGPLLIAGFMALSIKIGQSDEEHHHVLIIDEFGYMDQYIKSGRFPKDSKTITYHFTQENISNQTFIEDENLSLLIQFNEKSFVNNHVDLFHKSTPSLNTMTTIQGHLESAMEYYKLIENNADPEIYQRVRTSVMLDLYDVYEGSDSGMDPYERGIIGMIFSMFIYIFIFLYGAMVMRGVIEEKTNRIVEVLISSVKPFQLMLGKIIGIAMVGLTQFVMWVILVGIIFLALGAIWPDIYDANQVAAIQASPNVIEEVMELSNGESAQVNEMRDLIFNRIQWIPSLLMFLFYFIGGYLLYGSMFAAIGSAVDSETDTQQFMVPVSLPLLLGVTVAVLGMSNPESGALDYCAQIPFTSPIVMPMKFMMGEATMIEVISSMGLLVLTFMLTTLLAGKIYRTGILMYGKKVSYRELWKWLFYKG